ncbi:efflux transporter outer membrane subunit [Brenneria sp. 4F2]|nr:efflux transporter outer membrane subunit [Brenneria bubanii]
MNKKYQRRLMAPVLLTLALSACTLQPSYERPAMPTASNWNSTGAAGNTAANGADIGWRSFFTDPAMRQLIELALQNNRDLRVAAFNVETARAQFRIESAGLTPTANTGLSQTAEHLPGNLYSTSNSGPVTYHQLEGAMSTSWELDFFGRLRSLRDEALESYLSSEATRRATQISLVSEVASGYLTLCADNELLQLARFTAESQRDSYAVTQAGYDAGASNAQDLSQAETSVRSAEAQVAQYRRQVRLDANALRLLLGAELPANLLDNARLNGDWRFPATPAGLPSDLLTRRPDIIAAEHTLKAANADIGAARAAFFPSISLTASGGSYSSSLDHLLTGGTAFWSFVPSISVPIFDGGVNQANLDIARIAQRSDVAAYEKAIQQAFKEVADALAGQETYRDELSARRLDTAASQRYYDLAALRFRQGVDNHLNVLVAQRSLYTAQQSQITTRMNMLNQQITLYKALGGGWKE